MGELNLQKLLAQPAVRQIALLVGLAAAVAAGLTIFMWSQKPGYVPLYSGLMPKESGAVTEALSAAGIEHRLEPSGQVTVPGSDLHAARLKLAEQGLPKSAGVGFEMIREEQGFGVSKFIENARYHHALETELMRTIVNLQSVRNARVHLALPERSAFMRDRKQPSASVFLELYPGRSLGKGQIASIAHLVASGVPEMEATQVAIVDQQGRLLNGADGGEGSDLSSSQFEYWRRVETSYVERIESLLAPIAGPGRVNAQVSVDMDFSVIEEARERYDPDATVVRSEQITEDRNNSALARGVPGAASNGAGQDRAAEGAGGEQAKDQSGDSAVAGSLRKESTRNYEVDRTVSHSRQPMGRISRVSVAVLIDNLPKRDPETGETVPTPLTEAELARYEELIRGAVGFDPERGDKVNVMNASFRNQEVEDVPEPPIWETPAARDWARQILGALLVLVLLFAVLRPMLRQILNQPDFKSMRNVTPQEETPALGHEQAGLPAGAAPAGAQGGAAAAGALTAAPYEEKLSMARQAVNQDAKRVAQVVRTWVNNDG